MKTFNFPAPPEKLWLLQVSFAAYVLADTIRYKS
jgi:hypothetical protein